jgi:hypothetical protein
VVRYRRVFPEQPNGNHSKLCPGNAPTRREGEAEAVAADHGSYDLAALADEQFTELFGWPVHLLDEIRQLRERAYHHDMGIEEWRQRDASLRVGAPERFPREEMKAVQDAALDAWVSARVDDEQATGQRMWHLAERLGAALECAPDDDGLREQLSRIDTMLATERHQGVKARLGEERDLVAEWLAASARLDEQTGLPWDYLARYRRLADPVLGNVPAYLELARRRALAEAPGETARLARQVRPDAKPDPLAVSELNQHALTHFPRRIMEAASRGDSAAAAISHQMQELWQAPETQRFLLRETAQGWPEALREPDVAP